MDRAVAALVDALQRKVSWDRCVLLFDLGNLAREAGAVDVAERALRAALGILGERLPEEHPDLQNVRQNLAGVLASVGKLREADELYRKVLEARLRTLPGDHPEVNAARINTASSSYYLGDFLSARRTYEEALQSLQSTVPDDHPLLPSVRMNLAVVLREIGDLAGAQVLEEQVLARHLVTLPEGHPDLQAVRINLAMTKRSLGDLNGAAELAERALVVGSERLPDQHPDLQSIRLNLAGICRDRGDLERARALLEKVVRERESLGRDHPTFLLTLGNLAATWMDLGDLRAARVLQQEILDSRARTMPPEHPHLQSARANLASTLLALGEHQAASAMLEELLAVRLATLPSDHPDVQRTRLALAEALARAGELQGARSLEEEVLTVRSRDLPDDHPELQDARANLILSLVAEAAAELRAGGGGQGIRPADLERITALASSYTAGLTNATRRILASGSSREVEEIVANDSGRLGRALSFAEGLGVLPSVPALELAVFALSEASRAASLTRSHLARSVERDEQHEGLEAERRAACAEIARCYSSGGAAEELDAAIERRDRLEKELLERILALKPEAAAHLVYDPASVASFLQDDTALVAYRRYTRWTYDEASRAYQARDSVCAHVLRPEVPLARIELGLLSDIDAAIAHWRAAIGASPGRGIWAGEPASGRRSVRAEGERLRALTLDPLLPALEGVEHLVLVLDDVLHLVPFDALPALDGRTAGRASTSEAVLGDQYRIDVCTTSRELSWDRALPDGDGTLLTLGGADYSAAPHRYTDAEDASSSAPDQAEAAGTSEPEGPRPTASGGTPLVLRGGPWEAGFPVLPGTHSEALGLAALHALSHGERARAIVLEGRCASRASIEELAPKARWLHLATHGWIAHELSDTRANPAGSSRPPSFTPSVGIGERVVRASPMTLCGLALSGANLPADGLGRLPGLWTAEELSTLDLTGCELAVLSACDTNVGQRRAGQGVASLQRALQMAGARSVITSLWKVPDEATKELMLDFYRRLWVEKKPKHQALWEAKLKLRDARTEHGEPRYALRDWAAWVLTGEPD